LKFNKLYLVLIAAIIVSIAASVIIFHEKTNNSETPEMVQAMVSKAIKLYDEKGTDAFAIINDDPEFHGKQLYVYVFRDSDGILVAHGADKAIMGTNIDDNVDANGKNFGKDIIHDSATTEGIWVEYPWMDPVTQKILPKSAWIVEHDGYVFGSGIYSTDTSIDLVGDDRDEHGCIPSAGYSWSEEKQECVRPWEN
jgi:signal transduction histidine kinase